MDGRAALVPWDSERTLGVGGDPNPTALGIFERLPNEILCMILEALIRIDGGRETFFVDVPQLGPRWMALVDRLLHGNLEPQRDGTYSEAIAAAYAARRYQELRAIDSDARPDTGSILARNLERFPERWSAFEGAIKAALPSAEIRGRVAAEILAVLTKPGRINASVRGDNTPLCWAAQHGAVVLAKILVSKGANINHKGLRQQTPLVAACESKQKDFVQWLLTFPDVSLDDPDDRGLVALHYVLKPSSWDYSRQWDLRRGLYPEERDYYKRTAADIARALVMKGADIRIKTRSDRRSDRTPVHFAASSSCLPVLKDAADAYFTSGRAERGQQRSAFLDAVNDVDDDRKTPLHWAAEFGVPANVRLLIDANADVNARDKTGYTPLRLAFDERAKQILKAAGAAE